MSPDERDQHRRRIGFEVEVVMAAYWDKRLDPMVKARVLAWWADELEDWSVDQILWALRKWCRDEPDKPPNAGHILRLLKQRRGQACADRMAAERASAMQQDPPRDAPSPEECQRRSAQISEVLAGFARSRRM